MGASVLLVHDDIATIAAVRRLLSREGHEVILATSAADALIAFGHHLPELIVLAPGVESGRGRVVLEELVQHPEGHRARVLLLSESIEGFSAPVAPLPLDGPSFVALVDSLIHSPAEADGWRVMENRTLTPPAEGGGTESSGEETWHATAPRAVGGDPALANALFGDLAPLSQTDWELAAMTDEERIALEQNQQREQQTALAMDAAFEQTHQEVEAEAMASIDSVLAGSGTAGGGGEWAESAMVDGAPPDWEGPTESEGASAEPDWGDAATATGAESDWGTEATGAQQDLSATASEDATSETSWGALASNTDAPSDASGASPEGVSAETDWSATAPEGASAETDWSAIAPDAASAEPDWNSTAPEGASAESDGGTTPDGERASAASDWPADSPERASTQTSENGASATDTDPSAGWFSDNDGAEHDEASSLPSRWSGEGAPISARASGSATATESAPPPGNLAFREEHLRPPGLRPAKPAPKLGDEGFFDVDTPDAAGSADPLSAAEAELRTLRGAADGGTWTELPPDPELESGTGGDGANWDELEAQLRAEDSERDGSGNTLVTHAQADALASEPSAPAHEDAQEAHSNWDELEAQLRAEAAEREGATSQEDTPTPTQASTASESDDAEETDASQSNWDELEAQLRAEAAERLDATGGEGAEEMSQSNWDELDAQLQAEARARATEDTEAPSVGDAPAPTVGSDWFDTETDSATSTAPPAAVAPLSETDFSRLSEEGEGRAVSAPTERFAMPTPSEEEPAPEPVPPELAEQEAVEHQFEEAHQRVRHVLAELERERGQRTHFEQAFHEEAARAEAAIAQADAARSEAEAAVSLIERLQAGAQQSQVQVAELQALLSAANARATEASAALELARTHTEQAQAETTLAKARVAEERARADAESARSESLVGASEREVALTADLQALREQNAHQAEALGARDAELARLARDSEQRIAELEAQHSRLNEALERESSLRADTQAHSAAQTTALQAQLDKARARLDAESTARASVDATAKAALARVESREQDVTALQARLADLDRALAEQTRTRATAEARAESESQAHEDLEARLRESQAERERLDARILEAEARAESEARGRASLVESLAKEHEARLEAESRGAETLGALKDIESRLASESGGRVDAEARVAAEGKAHREAEARAEVTRLELDAAEARLTQETVAHEQARAAAEAQLTSEVAAHAETRAAAERQLASAVEAREEAQAQAAAGERARVAAELRAEQAMKARAEMESRAEAEIRAREAAEARAEAEAEARAEADARAEAAAKSRAEAMERAESEGRHRTALEVRMEVESRGRADAEARLEAESRARAEAEAEARRHHEELLQERAARAKLEADAIEQRAHAERERLALEERAHRDAEEAAAQARASLLPLEAPGRPELAVARSGSVTQEGLSRLLLRMCDARMEVRLELKVVNALRILWLRDGTLVGAASSAAGESLIDRARADGLIDARQEAELRLVRSATTGALLEALRGRGYLRETEAVPLVQRYTEQVFLDALAEPSTLYRLVQEPAPHEVALAAATRPPLHLLAEALRNTLTSESLLETAGSLRARVTRGDAHVAPSEFGFPSRELHLLEGVDGERTLEALLLSAGMPQDVTLKALSVARTLGLVALQPDTLDGMGDHPPELDVRRLEAKFEEVQDADYFTVLGLARSAGGEEVKRAYELLSAEFHPLRFAGHPDAALQHRAQQVRVILSEAARALGDDRLRAEYARNLLD
ncbi:response regulator receiver protein [Corallococcus sp. M34]|uniref:response regulator receiver protein n=1 Tax=Citreicoccus inhibens TaxID=2849499 RepID=UPI001C21F86C|nr:response regulator receiver protein [Citreicoccus inhibens]MBU8894345.1 response regulator receiver protein [Citreicoccus inhibens]